MPRRKMRPRQLSGLRLVPIYNPDKNNQERWAACLRNNDLVHGLLAGAPHMLDGCADFGSEEERKAAWVNNRAVIMAQKGRGWNPNIDPFRDFTSEGYLPGNRPWAYLRYELGLEVEPKWPDKFNVEEYEMLKSRGLLEDGEEELVAKYLARMGERVEHPILSSDDDAEDDE